MPLHNASLCVQSHWRSYTCRKKVQYFSQLPTDIWSMILTHLKNFSVLCTKIDRIIYLRLIRLYWSPPIFYKKLKYQTLLIVRQNTVLLSKRTLLKAVEFCARRLSLPLTENESRMVNATLEHLFSHHIRLNT